MDAQSHAIAKLLCDLGLAAADSFEPISDRVRDRNDVYALRCRKSGVIVLNRTDHINDQTYASVSGLTYWGDGARADLLKTTADDDTRRADFLRSLGGGGRYLDIGTGLGGILDLVRDEFAAVAAVELQSDARKALEQLGYTTYASVADAPENAFDVISLFHVYEHIPDQIDFLRQVRKLLRPGGRLIVEVPHANDALLSLYQNADFLKFTLWSQRLILHTRESLSRFMAAAGFPAPKILGVQRYPLANHLYWLAKGKPGGHKAWATLRSPALDAEYEAVLDAAQATDTLMAIAT